MSNLPLKFEKKEIADSPKVGEYDLLAHRRKTPNLLYGIFVELARQFYSNPDNHPMGTPVKIWSEDGTKSEIWIDTELRWEDEHPEKRPAVFVRLSPVTYSSLTGRKDGVCGMNMKEAETYFSRSGTGRVSFVHIGETAGEACMLGDATMDYLDAFGMVIRDDFCFTSFSLVERVPLAPRTKESKERYESVVTFEFVLQDKWTIKLESQRLKVFTFRAGQRLLDGGTV